LPANRKLTPLLAGRTVRMIEQAEALLNVLFIDGSSMKIKISAPPPSLELRDRRILKVRQAGTVLNLDFEDESTAEIQMAEATSSVMLRDASGALEYAD